MVAHVLHGGQDLFVGFPETDHQAALGRYAGEQGLEFFQQVQAERVVGARACFFVQPGHGFEVVVHDIGRRGFQDVEGSVIPTTEIGHQHLYLRDRRQFACGLDAGHKVASATVPEVVTVNTRDHHIVEFECGDGFGEVGGFVRIEWIGAAMSYVTKWAASGALVAHDHEGGRAFAKTLADVGTACLLTHGDQLVAAQHVLDLVKPCGGAAGFHTNPVGLFQCLGRHHLDGDARDLGGRLLLGRGIVVGRGVGWGGTHGVSNALR